MVVNNIRWSREMKEDDDLERSLDEITASETLGRSMSRE